MSYTDTWANKNKRCKLFVKISDTYDRSPSDQAFVLKSKPKRLKSKLMRLGSPNQIVVVESKPRSEFDRRLTTIQNPTINIDSTISISIENRSIFDILSI